MFWFKSRRQQRRVARKELRLGVEQLESRIDTGTIWSPGSPIDIQGITGNGSIVAAGSVVVFDIIGSGTDFDQWWSFGPFGFTGGQVQDTVTITWSGANCGIVDGGKRAVCQIGSAGSGSIVDILLDADDGSVLPAGDAGSRNDPAVHFGAVAYGIWVDIGVNSQGPMDGDDQGQLTFDDPPPQDRELGTTQSAGGHTGLFLKVELTGTVSPAVPDGTSVFVWQQTADVRTCYHRATGGDAAGLGTFDPDQPLAGNYTNATHNSKIFMIDNPGPIFDRLRSPASYDKVRFYFSFTTWVDFNGAPASDKEDWHINFEIHSDGTAWQAGMSTASPAEPGQDPDRPTGDPTPGLRGFRVDCSNQVWQ